MNGSNELTVLSEHLDRYRGVSLQTLVLVPDEKLDWRPFAAARSFAEHFLHIAQTEDFYAHGIFTDNWDFSRVSPPEQPISRAIIQRRFMEVRAFTMEAISCLGDERLGSPITIPHLPVRWALRSWLWYLVEHEVHHKAQLSLYLRQIGVVPPFFAFVLPAGVRPDIVG